MAIDDTYLSEVEYRDRVGTLTSGADLNIRSDLIAFSRIIEDESGQFFNKDDEPVARVFRAKWSDRLDLDYEGLCPGIADTTDMVLKVDTDGDGSFADEVAWTINSDFLLEPLQALQGPRRKPYNTAKTCGNKSFVPGALVQITALWGWYAVPEEVKALLEKCLRVWRLDGPEGTARVSEMGSVFSMSLDVKRQYDLVMRMCRTQRITF